jgi:hypothetical protein
MSRLRPRVILPETAQDVLNTGETADSYSAQIVKYIPGETITAYQAVAGIVTKVAADDQAMLLTWAAVSGLAFTFIWTLLGAKDQDNKDEPWAWTQAIVATLAFCVWLFAIDSPFVHQYFDMWNQLKGSVVLILATGMALPLLGRVLTRVFGLP